MVLRRIILIFGVLLILLGVSQLLFADWWIVVPGAVRGSAFALFLIGLLAVAIGGVFLVATVTRLVGLLIFMLIVGAIVLAEGVVVLVSPDIMRDLLDALVLNRAHAFQVVAIWISGLIRIALGVAIVYAVMHPPVTGGAERANAPTPNP